MIRRCRHIVVLLCCAVVLTARAAVVLATDFERNPLAHDDWYASWGSEPGVDVAWEARAEGGRCLRLTEGRIVSPSFTVKAGQHYRLTLATKGGGRPMWAAFFMDGYGWYQAGDHYAGIDATAAWTTHAYVFTTKFPGVSARLVIDSCGPETLLVDDLRLETITPSEADAVVAAREQTLPAIIPPAPADAAARLPRIRAKLLKGGPARVVVLGDSIGNDLSNAPLDVLLRRAYPKAAVELRFTGRGSTGYDIFQRSVDVTVVKHKPDLLILLSITNRRDSDLAGNLQAIIDGVRAELPNLEILLVTPHVDDFSPNQLPGSAQREVLRQLAEKNRLPMVDLLAAWQNYLQATGKPLDWLLRDVVHMNERGRLVSATAVAAWLLPEQPKE